MSDPHQNPDELPAIIAVVTDQLRRAHPDVAENVVESTVRQAAIELAGATHHHAQISAMIRRRATARMQARHGSPIAIQTTPSDTTVTVDIKHPEP